eukprot:3214852-Alexandrium_andersonii.AAC.1
MGIVFASCAMGYNRSLFTAGRQKVLKAMRQCKEFRVGSLCLDRVSCPGRAFPRHEEAAHANADPDLPPRERILRDAMHTHLLRHCRQKGP